MFARNSYLSATLVELFFLLASLCLPFCILTLLHSKAAALCSSLWRKQWLHLLLLNIFGENLRQSAVRPTLAVGGGVAASADVVVVIVEVDILCSCVLIFSFLAAGRLQFRVKDWVRESERDRTSSAQCCCFCSGLSGIVFTQAHTQNCTRTRKRTHTQHQYTQFE